MIVLAFELSFAYNLIKILAFALSFTYNFS